MKPLYLNGNVPVPDLNNRAIFTGYFRQYYASLCFYADRIIKDSEAAEDIVEEIFVKIWNKPRPFESEQHLKAFLYRSVKNACLDFIKTTERSNKRDAFFSEE